LPIFRTTIPPRLPHRFVQVVSSQASLQKNAQVAAGQRDRELADAATGTSTGFGGDDLACFPACEFCLQFSV
jgi:hypothetical protein